MNKHIATACAILCLVFTSGCPGSDVQSSGCQPQAGGSGCIPINTNVPVATGPTQPFVPIGGLPTALTEAAAEQWKEPGGVPAAAPPRLPVTPDEERAIRQALGKLPPFPPNPLNGCESRAQVVFNSLGAPSNHKVAKVWLFAGTGPNPVLNGAIHYSKDSTSRWNYHVAVSYFVAPGDIRVVDALTSADVLTISQWLSRFTFDGHAVLTVLPGDRYLFQTADADGGKKQLTGLFWRYDGCFKDTHDGAKALAADAFAAHVSASATDGCEWNTLRTDAIKIKAAFSDHMSEETFSECTAPSGPPTTLPQRQPPPAACQTALAQFRKDTDRWEALGL